MPLALDIGIRSPALGAYSAVLDVFGAGLVSITFFSAFVAAPRPPKCVAVAYCLTLLGLVGHKVVKTSWEQFQGNPLFQPR